MADPITPPPGDAQPATQPELLALRDQIDAIDRELLALINRRAGVAQHVGEIKKKEGSVVFRPEREAQVIDGLKSVNPGPLKNDSVAPIWREIMSACRALETPTRVAYLEAGRLVVDLPVQRFFHARPDRPSPPIGLRLRLPRIAADGATGFHAGLRSEEEPESRSDDRPTSDVCSCLGDLLLLLRHGEPPDDGE